MNRKQKDHYDAYTELQKAGLEFETMNYVAYNAGGSAETVPHIVGKALAGYVGGINGWRVASEVEVENGDIDVLLYANPERQTYAVEIESNIERDVIMDKVDRYVRPYPIDDLIAIEATEIPMGMIEAAEYIAQEIGVEI